MSHYEDRHLDFVLKHWQSGRFDTQKAIDRFRESHGIAKPEPRTRLFRVISGLAAAAVLVVGLFILRQQTGWTELMAEGRADTFELPDGSQVTLAPGSVLSYRKRDFGRDSRDVRMDGKVFFDVTADPESPFEVRTDGGFVRVLGTEFQVDASGTDVHGDEQVHVYVRSGKVLFSKSERSEGVILTEGMGARLSGKALKPETDAVSKTNSLAWCRGSFIFDSVPLKQVLDELGAYYGVSFAATDLDRKLSGEFSTDDLDLIVELIESALDVTIIRK